MVIKDTTWDFPIDSIQIGQRTRGVEKDKFIEQIKTYRGIVGACFSCASMREAESTIGCA
jgi:hypothetical protein